MSNTTAAEVDKDQHGFLDFGILSNEAPEGISYSIDDVDQNRDQHNGCDSSFQKMTTSQTSSSHEINTKESFSNEDARRSHHYSIKDEPETEYERDWQHLMTSTCRHEIDIHEAEFPDIETEKSFADVKTNESCKQEPYSPIRSMDIVSNPPQLLQELHDLVATVSKTLHEQVALCARDVADPCSFDDLVDKAIADELDASTNGNDFVDNYTPTLPSQTNAFPPRPGNTFRDKESWEDVDYTCDLYANNMKREVRPPAVPSRSNLNSSSSEVLPLCSTSQERIISAKIQEENSALDALMPMAHEDIQHMLGLPATQWIHEQADRKSVNSNTLRATLTTNDSTATGAYSEPNDIDSMDILEPNENSVVCDTFEADKFLQQLPFNNVISRDMVDSLAEISSLYRSTASSR